MTLRSSAPFPKTKAAKRPPLSVLHPAWFLFWASLGMNAFLFASPHSPFCLKISDSSGQNRKTDKHLLPARYLFYKPDIFFLFSSSPCLLLQPVFSDTAVLKAPIFLSALFIYNKRRESFKLLLLLDSLLSLKEMIDISKRSDRFLSINRQSLLPQPYPVHLQAPAHNG